MLEKTNEDLVLRVAGEPEPIISVKRGYRLVVDEKGVRAELVNDAPHNNPNPEETSNA